MSSPIYFFSFFVVAFSFNEFCTHNLKYCKQKCWTDGSSKANINQLSFFHQSSSSLDIQSYLLRRCMCFRYVFGVQTYRTSGGMTGCLGHWIHLPWGRPFPLLGRRSLGKTKLSSSVAWFEVIPDFQWLFLVPLKGGRDYITPQKAIYKWYISGMHCYLPPFTRTKNNHWTSQAIPLANYERNLFVACW